MITHALSSPNTVDMQESQSERGARIALLNSFPLKIDRKGRERVSPSSVNSSEMCTGVLNISLLVPDARNGRAWKLGQLNPKNKRSCALSLFYTYFSCTYQRDRMNSRKIKDRSE